MIKFVSISSDYNQEEILFRELEIPTGKTIHLIYQFRNKNLRLCFFHFVF